MKRLWWIALALSAALLQTSNAAFAADSQTQLQAEKLFREGRAALSAGDLVVACTKFEESQKLDPSAGTVLNLADCYERSGKLAAALTSYREAAKQAQLRGRKDWSDTAHVRAAALEKLVASITIKVPDSVVKQVPDLEVFRDNTKVDPSTYGTSIPLEAGEHVIRATAPNHETFSTTVKLAKNGVKETVEIPILKKADSSASDPPPPPVSITTPIKPDDSSASNQRTLGLVGIGVGVAGILAGGLTGVLASSSLDDAKSDCPSYPDRCRPAGNDANGRAETYALISTIAFIAGGVIAAGGTFLFVTAKKPAAAKTGYSYPLRFTF